MTDRVNVETVCAPEWVEFDAYASRTARGFWHMGETLCRIRDKSQGSYHWGLEQRGINPRTANNWARLSESMTVEEAGRYPSLRTALQAIAPETALETGNAFPPETAGQSAAQPIEGEVLLPFAVEPDDYDYDTAEDAALGRTESPDAFHDRLDAELGVTSGHDVDDEQAAAVPGQDDTESPQRQLRPPSRKHPATYSGALFPIFAALAHGEWQRIDGKPRYLSVLDPMAGEGSILNLGDAIPPGGAGSLTATGVQLDVQASDIHAWQYAQDEVMLMDATELAYPAGSFDMIITSPPYANRMADKISVDGDNRVTYADRRGCDAGPNDATGLSWGDAYRILMATIWTECVRVTRPGGLIVLNSKDHARAGHLVPVTEWHVNTLLRLGCTFERLRQVETWGVKGVSNDEFRAAGELVIGMRKAME